MGQLRPRLLLEAIFDLVVSVEFPNMADDSGGGYANADPSSDDGMRRSQRVCEEVDELRTVDQHRKAYDACKQALQSDPNNAELMWRLARGSWDIAEGCAAEGNKKGAETFYREGSDQAKQAIDIATDCSYAYKWQAINLGKLGSYISTTDKIKNSFTIKEAAKRSLEIKPDDPGTYHLLGEWCLQVASVSWIEKKAAAAIFGTPPESSYEEAAGYFLKAHELDPTLIDTMKSLGDVYVAMRKKADAERFYKKVLETPATTAPQKRVHAEVVAKLKKL